MSAKLPVDDDTNRLVDSLIDKWMFKSVRNRLRQSYYDSHRHVLDLVSVVPEIYKGYAFALGWSAKAVDALARRCTFQGFMWPDGDLDSLGYREWRDANRLVSEANWAVSDSLLYGPAFYVASSGGGGEPTSLLQRRDALQMVGEWDSRTRSLKAALSIDEMKDGVITQLTLFQDGSTLAASRESGTAKWDVGLAVHPGLGVLAEPVTYHPTGGRPLGRGRISRPMMALQDAAMRGLMRLEGHMDVFAFPEYWMLGADESIFKNADGSQMAAWRIRMGRIKGVPDDDDIQNPRADVKQFAASDPTPHLAQLNALAKLFAREASLPDSALAITDVSNPTSAESYDAAQYELIAEAEGAIEDWRPGFRAVALKGLAIQNGLTYIPDSWRSLDSLWRNPRYLAKSAEADAGVKQVSAVPGLAETSVGLELLGLTPQQIERFQSERRRNAGSALLEQLRGQVVGAVEG